MALPSQGGRVAAGGGGRRRKKNGAPILPISLILLAGGAAGAYFLWFDDQPSEPGQPSALNSNDAPQEGRSDTGQPNTESPTAERPGITVPPPVEMRSSAEASPSTSETNTQQASADRNQTEPVSQRANLSNPRDPDPRRPVGPSSSSVLDALERAEAAVRQNDLLRARQLLTQVILSGGASDLDRDRAREDAAMINEQLVFSPLVVPGDPIALEYRIQPGDTLSRIAANQGLAVDWRLIQRINNIQNPSRIRLGQRLKLLRGPFHAIVNKDSYRIDLFQGPPEEMGEWTYIRSFDVGLGEYDGTPLGRFVVREDSKLIDPKWINPRTGEVFEASDPMNPIGEHWLGLRGLGEAADVVGYGIHGTIEPNSIGQQASMGCVRLGAEDIAIVYEMLEEGVSVVEIRE